MKTQLSNFEQAFSTGGGSCVDVCHCGHTFYDAVNSYSWAEGELESLQKNPKATALGYSVGSVEFEGKTYNVDCSCWHDRANKIIAFIDTHNQEIAEWLSLEKKRKQEEADASPVVDQ